MERDDSPTVWELDRRMIELARDLHALEQLVDGQGPRTVRTRLHEIEAKDRGAELVAAALDAFRAAEHRVHSSRWKVARDWLAVGASLAAVVISALALLHGLHALAPAHHR